VPWLKLFRRRLPVTAVDFCYGWTLWLFLSWTPSFFYQNFQQDLMQSALYSAGVFFAGVIGDTLGGVVSDRILRRSGDRNAARRNVIVVGLLGGFLFLMPVMLVQGDQHRGERRSPRCGRRPHTSAPSYQRYSQSRRCFARLR
jgi:MFS family permease